jgi:tetratricopeptide (TPR) repeat protein
MENLVAECHKILSLDPTQYNFLQWLGVIYMIEGEFEDAVKYLRKYADALPNNAEPFIVLGNMYTTFGKHEQAYAYYQKAMLIEPDDISIQLLLADIKVEMGDFSSALTEYEEILQRCNTPQEKVEAFNRLENYFFLRGKVQKAIDYIHLRLAEQEKFDTRMNILDTRILSIERYILAGKTDSALKVAKDLEETLGPPHDHYIPYAYLRLYLEVEEADSIDKYLGEYEARFEERTIVAQGISLNWPRGKLHEVRGDYHTAILFYSMNLEVAPINPGMDFHIGRCYRMAGDYKKAEEHFQKIIDLHPYWPEELYEFGLVYAEWGKRDKAIKYLTRAQDIWADADPEYQPARELREKLAELGISVQYH